MKAYIFYFLFSVSLINILFFGMSCTSGWGPDQNLPDSLTQVIINRESVFDPAYFRSNTNFHFLLKIRYVNGNYVLAHNKIYKVPGRYRKVLAPGNLTVAFLTSGNGMIDSITTNPPYSFIKEESADSTHMIDLDLIDFNLSIPPDNIIRKISFFENFQLKNSINIPTDTFDVIQQNNNAPLDSTLF